MKNRRKPALLKYDNSQVFSSASASSAKSPSSSSAPRISVRNLSRFAGECSLSENSAGTENSTRGPPSAPCLADNWVCGSERTAQPQTELSARHGADGGCAFRSL